MDIIEMFAGVGGFRVGFERVNENHKEEPKFFNTIWSNQFEPSTKYNMLHAHTNEFLAKMVILIKILQQ